MFSHLGDMDIPIISDTTHALSKAYGVLKEDEGIAYRGLFIIDTKGKQAKPGLANPGRRFHLKNHVIIIVPFLGIIRQVTINDLPVGRSVDEVKRLIQGKQGK